MFKNTASQKLQIFAFDTTTGAPKTGDAANLTAYVAKDYGTVTVLGDTSATEMDATNAKGWYLFDLTQAETNADSLLFTAKSTTANISLVGVWIFTLPSGFTALTTATIATGIWQDTTSGDFTTASSIGKSLYTAGVVPGGTNGLFIAGTNAATTITTSLTTTFTGSLTGSVASVTGLTASDVGAIKTKTDFLPSITAGAAGGVFIAGTNAATTITTSLTTTFTGNLTGSVGSVTGNVGGNVTGSVDSVVGAVGSVTGAVGSVTGSVGSVVGLTASNLDTTVSSRMATYTQPTGFLAATFPLTVASTTNITAGTITTVTNLTNAPTAGDFTSTMKTSLNAATPAVTVSDKTGFSLSTAAYNATADATWARDMSLITRPGGSTRYPLQAIDVARNKVDTSVVPAVIYQDDDSTTSFELTLTTDAAAELVVAQEP